MKDPLTTVLLGWGDSRWMWATVGRRPPERTACMPLGPVVALGLWGMVAAGLPVLVLGRLLSGGWSGWAFWIPGSVGLFTGLLAGVLIWLAWNRRAGAWRALREAGRPLPEPVAGSAWWRRLASAGVFLVLLATGCLIASGLENARGARALRAFREDLRARGEPVVLADVVPPAVPDERNLAMAPVLQPLLAYRRVPDARGRGAWHQTVEWLDTNGLERLRAVGTEDRKETYAAFAKKKVAAQQSWREGGRIDLASRQAYYVSLKDWEPAEASDSPARDVLRALSRFDDVIQELRAAAAERPDARFPVRYEESFSALLSHLAPMKGLSSHLALRATALLADGRSGEALADIQLAARLSDAMRIEPLLISYLVGLAIDLAWLQPLWEGCLDHRWTDAELVALQALLEQRNYLADVRDALRGERVLADLAYDAMVRRDVDARALGFAAEPDGALEPGFVLFLRVFNKGWIRQNQVVHGRYVDLTVQDLLQCRSHADLPAQGERLGRMIDKRSVFSFLAGMLAPALDRAGERAFEAEAVRRLAVVGIALERHRLAGGRYPAALADLAPRFLPADGLTDPMDGQPLRYTATANGDDYRLYSVGLDHQDSGGVRGDRKARSAAHRKVPGDLVWR